MMTAAEYRVAELERTRDALEARLAAVTGCQENARAIAAARVVVLEADVRTWKAIARTHAIDARAFAERLAEAEARIADGEGAMSQARHWSALEASTQMIVGYLVGVALNAVVLPLYGLPRPTLRASAGMAFWFALASLARGYTVRRAFVRLEGLTLRRRGIAAWRS